MVVAIAGRSPTRCRCLLMEGFYRKLAEGNPVDGGAPEANGKPHPSGGSPGVGPPSRSMAIPGCSRC